LGIAAPEPLYVLRKELATNTLVVGREEELGQRSLIAEGVNWVCGTAPDGPVRVTAKIRYKATEAAATIQAGVDGQVRVEFDQPLRDITAGQRVVFYQGEECLGGGAISDDRSADRAGEL
jgi:tRNA-specific 2-thiouridylase